MKSDVFTKNLARPQFEKHIKVFVGEDSSTSSRTPKRRVSEDNNMSCECRNFIS